MPVKIQKFRCASDARGQVFEPLELRELGEQRNVHVVLTEPGQIRGNHFHHLGAEVSAVVGPARVRYREGPEVRTVDVPPGEAWRFTFAPGVVHAFQNTGSAPMIIVSFNTVAHDPQNPDTQREVIL
jgi:UDP-2-acetamido-2,6-beta-L-arabino-hexul-4-ose reductase